MTIGEKIKKLRKESGMYQVNVAEQLGINYQTIGIEISENAEHFC